jgi:catechol 2,3-dioxygenase-like lactoylglutathione lyase family enzyme
MALTKMEHFLVLTDDLERSRAFSRDVLGLQHGFRLAFGLPGYWLYLGDVFASRRSRAPHSRMNSRPHRARFRS